jgi:hypothetical protein
MSANRWWRRTLASKGAGGAQCKLTSGQVAELEAVLDDGPQRLCGYADECWILAGSPTKSGGGRVSTRWPGWMGAAAPDRVERAGPAGLRSGTRARSPGDGRRPGRSKSTAADLGRLALLPGRVRPGLRPPKGHTWGRRSHTLVVQMTGGHNTRVSLAALIATRPGCQVCILPHPHRPQA